MKPGEVLAPESLLLEQRDGERVPERERDGGAGRWREVVGARLFTNRGVEPHVGMPCQRGRPVAGDRDRPYTQPLELFQQRQQLVGLATLRE